MYYVWDFVLGFRFLKKILGIIVLVLLLGTSTFADVAGRYKKGLGPLKISKNIADILEFYFSGGKKGKYAKKQKDPWIVELIVISADGNHYSAFKTPKRYQNTVAAAHYTGQAIQTCEKKSGQECYLFSSRQRIVWDNGSDKKKRKLKRKDIKAGKTLQILQELGFYDGNTSNTQKIKPKIIKKKKVKKLTKDDDLVKKLKDLKELFDSGAINQDEFDKAKKKILN